MSRLSKDEIIVRLERLLVQFDPEADYKVLNDLLKANSPQEVPEPIKIVPVVEAQPVADKSEPLTEQEKVELADLERQARMGRQIDQPMPSQMIRLSVLRQRSKL